MQRNPVRAAGQVAKRSTRWRGINANVLFVLPALVVYLFYLGWPIVSVMRDSLYDWDGIHANRTFVGLANYVSLLTADRIFLGSVKNNVAWGLVTIGAELIMGFALAYALNVGGLRLRGAYRAIVFLPLTASGVAIGLAWYNIYDPNFGLVNGTLRAWGLGGLARPWLGDPRLALLCVMVAAVWRDTGFWVVIYLSGLQSISTELFDAAMIDGANDFQRMWHVAIPGVRTTTSTLLIFGAISAVGAFDLAYVMTQGGPYHASELMSLRIFNLAFLLNRTGYASALSVLLTVIAGIITFFQLRRYMGAD